MPGAEEKNLRVALGVHYGSPARLAFAALFVAGALLTFVELGWGVETYSVGELLVASLIPLALLVPPQATRARVERERAWTRSLPFALEGYFEALGAEPKMSCVLTITLAWSDPAQAAASRTLEGMLGAVDAGAHVESRDAATAIVRSSPIVDRAWLRVNRAQFAHSNGRVVAYVHRLVDAVLLPLHGSHPVARVSLTRR